MHRGSPRLAGLAAALVLVVVAGCGDEQSARLSPVDYRERADAICADADAALSAIGEPSTAGELEAFLRDGLEIGRHELAALRALDPPSAQADDHTAALGLIERQLGVVQGALARFDGGEDPVDVLVATQKDITALNEKAGVRADALGLRVCGSRRGASPADSVALGEDSENSSSTPIARR